MEREYNDELSQRRASFPTYWLQWLAASVRFHWYELSDCQENHIDRAAPYNTIQWKDTYPQCFPLEMLRQVHERKCNRGRYVVERNPYYLSRRHRWAEGKSEYINRYLQNEMSSPKNHYLLP
jgi:hypothetical protein